MQHAMLIISHDKDGDAFINVPIFVDWIAHLHFHSQIFELGVLRYDIFDAH